MSHKNDLSTIFSIMIPAIKDSWGHSESESYERLWSDIRFLIPKADSALVRTSLPRWETRKLQFSAARVSRIECGPALVISERDTFR